MRAQVGRPGVDVARRRHRDADVIQLAAPVVGAARRSAVQRQVVVRAGRAVQVDVVGVGPPLDLVTHGAGPEALGGGEIGDHERDVTDAEQRGVRHQT